MASLLVEVGAALALTLPIVLASRMIEDQTEGLIANESPAARRLRAIRGRRRRSVEAHIESFAKGASRLNDLSRALEQLSDRGEEVFFVYLVGATVVTVVWRGGPVGELVVGDRAISGDGDTWVEDFVTQVESEFQMSEQLRSIDDVVQPLARCALYASELLAKRYAKPALAGVAIWRDAQGEEASAVLLADGRALVADEEMPIATLNVEALAVSGRFVESGDGARVVGTACEVWTQTRAG